jgi:hypothetical protein
MYRSFSDFINETSKDLTYKNGLAIIKKYEAESEMHWVLDKEGPKILILDNPHLKCNLLLREYDCVVVTEGGSSADLSALKRIVGDLRVNKIKTTPIRHASWPVMNAQEAVDKGEGESILEPFKMGRTTSGTNSYIVNLIK